jgi:hypothetical protein
MMRFTEAQLARARRRKSPWNLLLVPAVLGPLVIFWVAAVLLAQQAHLNLYPGQTLRNAKGLWVIVAVMAPVLAAVPLGMLVGNFLVWQIRPARRALDQEAASDPAVTYGASQSALRKVLFPAMAVAAAATALGILLSWK